MSISEPEHDGGQERFEKQLREFRPAAPRALAMPARHMPRSVLAAAATVLVVIGALLVLRIHRDPERVVMVHTTRTAGADMSVATPITLGKFNAALRSSDQDLEQILDNASPRVLPRGHRGTALFELGKE